MKNGNLHLTLREILAELASPRLLAIVVGVILVCVIAGPFQTLQTPVLFRVAYWSVTISLATVMSFTMITYAMAGPLAPGWPPVLRGVIAAMLFSLIYSGVLVALGFVFFPENPSFPRYFAFIGYTMPIAIGITLIVNMFRGEAATTADASGVADAGAEAPRILKRIRPRLGTRLTRLSMQDHYVEVFTEKGSQLVLMRFADALEEVAPVPGWRIHRSHWVAETAMHDIRRADGKTNVVLPDGAELPISRTYLPALRDAGVLKRFD